MTVMLAFRLISFSCELKIILKFYLQNNSFTYLRILSWKSEWGWERDSMISIASEDKETKKPTHQVIIFPFINLCMCCSP